MPPKVPIPPKRLSTKALRPVSDAVLQDLMFLAYQAGELCLCETDRNLKARLYAREACWEQRYANMLAKWEQKTDLEWEDMLPTNITTRSVKGCKLTKSIWNLPQYLVAPEPSGHSRRFIFPLLCVITLAWTYKRTLNHHATRMLLGPTRAKSYLTKLPEDISPRPR